MLTQATTASAPIYNPSNGPGQLYNPGKTGIQLFDSGQPAHLPAFNPTTSDLQAQKLKIAVKSLSTEFKITEEESKDEGVEALLHGLAALRSNPNADKKDVERVSGALKAALAYARKPEAESSSSSKGKFVYSRENLTTEEKFAEVNAFLGKPKPAANEAEDGNGSSLTPPTPANSPAIDSKNLAQQLIDFINQ